MDELLELIPSLHKEIGLLIVEDSEELTSLVRSRMRKYDLNGDGVLSMQEFLELYRWTLWLKYEDLDPPIQTRTILIKDAHKGNPMTYYEIGQQIGQGMFGIVNLVKHRESGHERVLKTINKRTAVAAGTPLAMLSQEMDILALLDHPHVLRLFEHYNDTENIYIVTDVCYGGHLLNIVEEHCSQRIPMPEAWVSRVFKQAIEAVGYCHSKGVMHKDIKFENLMLNKAVTCKSPLQDIHVIVIDVGLSELFGPMHRKGLRSNMSAGSPATMAPEVIRRDFSYKCDIWSFGCLLYAIFNNQPAYLPDGAGGQVLYTYPFSPAPTEQDPWGLEGLARAQLAGPPMQPLRAVSQEGQDAVIRMLTCDERMRPSAQECLRLPWFSTYNPTKVLELSEDQVRALLEDREVHIFKRAVTLEAATQLPVSAVLQLEQEFEAMAASTGGTQIQCSVLADALEPGELHTMWRPRSLTLLTWTDPA
jgi:calcium-dependent protein kinase